MQFILILAVIAIVALIIWLFAHNHKVIKTNCVLLVTGAPKTGKSLLDIYITTKKYKSNLKKVKFQNLLRRILGKEEKPLPHLYSNIPLKIKGYKPLLKEHLTRNYKFEDYSVIYLGEFSLVANSTLGTKRGTKDGVNYDLINEQLLLFTKLIGHEIKGGYMAMDTQVIADCHYAAKRCLSNYFYIHHSMNIPFFKILWVKECLYSDDTSTTQAQTTDLEDGLQWLIIPKRKYYKMYDYRCYSILTDNLPLSPDYNEIPTDLKAREIVSFTDYQEIKNFKEREQKNEQEI
jgi:hypothetical protein